MSATTLILKLDTAYPLWVVRQMLEIVADRAKLNGFELTDNTVDSFTLVFGELPDGGNLDALKASLKDLGTLPSVSLHEYVEE